MLANVRAHMTLTPSGLTESLLDWHSSAGRDLPWRLIRDPWKILVSEVMSHQTQIDRVVPKWCEFIEKWPSPGACAGASLGDLLRVWQGLGYPRRAKNLQAAAIAITEHHGGVVPNSLEALLSLPGVGPYTARAVLAFAFEEDVAVVDTNTARILSRWAGQSFTSAQVQARADEHVPTGLGWDWNQAILDLGALVCIRRVANCGECPVRQWCSWRGEGEDPSTATAGVSSRQAAFAGSDRQARGRLLKAAQQRQFSVESARIVTRIIDDAHRVDILVSGLVAEGLLIQAGGMLSLPD